MLLEIIALTVADARAAELGGADRLEVITDMASDGLTPSPDLVDAIRAAVDIPLRVMLRDQDGFTVDRARLADLVTAAKTLRAAGADEFVLGFLTPDGRVDMAATETLVDALDGASWTFHRAFDNASDAESAWPALCALPGLDYVLTAGSALGLSQGLPALAERAHWQEQGVRFIAGGGLRHEHVPDLVACGVTAIHAGALARPDWDTPVDPERVRSLRDLLHGALTSGRTA
ncbi:copper homeostasis protein CutC [Actinokineospora sp. HUAS TT18]|uniref:copper homeostasis protein CutC n=1 Tax=Actinokineospora sp. HUAS TT18 TaxID=3447451 RepID=UPI003F521F7D